MRHKTVEEGAMQHRWLDGKGQTGQGFWSARSSGVILLYFICFNAHVLDATILHISICLLDGGCTD
jgi:hypothetical protein